MLLLTTAVSSIYAQNLSEHHETYGLYKKRGYSTSLEMTNSFATNGNDNKMFIIESLHGYYEETGHLADFFAYGGIGFYSKSYGADITKVSNIKLNGTDAPNAVVSARANDYSNFTFSAGFQIFLSYLGGINDYFTPFVNLKFRYLHDAPAAAKFNANYDNGLSSSLFPYSYSFTYDCNFDISVGGEFVTTGKIKPYFAVGYQLLKAQSSGSYELTHNDSGDTITFDADMKTPRMFSFKVGLRF